MTFLTQTLFTYLMLYYMWRQKNDINRKNMFFVALAFLIVMIYLIAYIYLLFQGQLGWIEIIGLVSVLCFSGLIIVSSLKSDQSHER